MAQQSVIDEIGDNGPKLNGHLDASNTKEVENMKRFHTARAKKFQKAKPKNILEA